MVLSVKSLFHDSGVDVHSRENNLTHLLSQSPSSQSLNLCEAHIDALFGEGDVLHALVDPLLVCDQVDDTLSMIRPGHKEQGVRQFI